VHIVPFSKANAKSRGIERAIKNAAKPAPNSQF